MRSCTWGEKKDKFLLGKIIVRVIGCENNQQKQIYSSINKLIKLKKFCELVYTQSMVGYLVNKALFQDSEAKSSEFWEKKNDPRINNVKLGCQMKDSNDYVIEEQIMVSGLGGEILRERMWWVWWVGQMRGWEEWTLRVLSLGNPNHHNSFLLSLINSELEWSTPLPLLHPSGARCSYGLNNEVSARDVGLRVHGLHSEVGPTRGSGTLA